MLVLRTAAASRFRMRAMRRSPKIQIFCQASMRGTILCRTCLRESVTKGFEYLFDVIDALAPGGYVWRTLSIVAAGNEDVDKTRDNELTDVSPELVGLTPPNDCCSRVSFTNACR